MAMKLTGRERRKLRIRNKISGTESRPRLTVFRSSKHIYAQVVDDGAGKTLASASTLSPDLKGAVSDADKTEAAKKVGALIARNLRQKFDCPGGLRSQWLPLPRSCSCPC